jgi:hypothetical protein
MPQEKLVNIKLSEIRPNPNRDLKFNPFNEEKITALMASIGETGFWTNVIVRKSPDGKGYEQAYGHHRIEAARRSGIKEADFVVRDLDENMMLKMMELENQEDYRYCPLSLLESVKAVVNALAAGRIAPFYRVEDGTLPPEGDPERYKGTTKMPSGKWLAQAFINGGSDSLGTYATREEAARAYRAFIKGKLDLSKVSRGLRVAPSFVPCSGEMREKGNSPIYSAADLARFLGNKERDNKIETAISALYLLEVKAISTAMIKEMNWSQLGKFVADIKAKRERVILRTKKTAAEVAAITEESKRIQAEHKAKEKKTAEERAALVKKLAEAKREADVKEAKRLKEKIEAKEKAAEEEAVYYEAERAKIDQKVKDTKEKEAENKKEEDYQPHRQETKRIVSMLERRDLEDQLKALARRPLNTNDRQLVRNATISLGTWYKETMADLFLPPLSIKSNLEDYRRREATKQRAEEKETK